MRVGSAKSEPLSYVTVVEFAHYRACDPAVHVHRIRGRDPLSGRGDRAVQQIPSQALVQIDDQIHLSSVPVGHPFGRPTWDYGHRAVVRRAGWISEMPVSLMQTMSDSDKDIS